MSLHLQSTTKSEVEIPLRSFVCSLSPTFISACAQSDATTPRPSLKDPSHFLGTQSPERFVAAHGQRGFIAGYATKGLEAWVYPFQIFKNYRGPFHHPALNQQSPSDSIDSVPLLNKIEYRPDSITRVYQGPDFTVREKLFVPLNSPGGLITYSVQSKSPIQIELHITPVLGLMWPANLAQANGRWHEELNAFTMFDWAHGYRGIMASPQTITHSWRGDSNKTLLSTDELQLTLQPNSLGNATLAWALTERMIHVITDADPLYIHEDDPQYAPGAENYQSLIENQTSLEASSINHYKAYEENLLQVQTPDPVVNQAIRWSQIALEQAWACNPDIGCGFVAGYGPSRIERRPQYAWFFAGDGLVSADAALSVGDFAHAREELGIHPPLSRQKIWNDLA